MKTGIARIEAREVLDSRGQPTVEVEVHLSGGARGRALVPSGASTGQHEALELRDKDARFRGKGVRRAVEHAQGPLARAVHGKDAADLATVDAALRAADGTPNLSAMGANAVLGVSLATAHAAAAGLGEPLYRFVNRCFGGGPMRLPVPMLNVLNGGAHADNGLDLQEVMIAPTGVATFAEALRAGAEVYQALKQDLHAAGLSTSVGDEGGFAPRVATCEEAIERVEQAVRTAGYEPGRQVRLALDAAATEFHVSEGSQKGRYDLEGRVRTAEEAVALYARWAEQHPIYSLEDGLAEDDWAGWKSLTARLGARMQLVGDDLFVTNTERLSRGLREGVANAVLVKPNQIGTLTDTLACVRAAYAGGYGVVMSHRSGETEDTTIADLAVALGTGQIKTGAPCRGERTAKYNRLLRIEGELARELGRPPAYGLRPAGEARA